MLKHKTKTLGFVVICDVLSLSIICNHVFRGDERSSHILAEGGVGIDRSDGNLMSGGHIDPLGSNRVNGIGIG